MDDGRDRAQAEPRAARSQSQGLSKKNPSAIAARTSLLRTLGLCLVAISALVLRFHLYGDPRLAIGTPDTQSYIDSSRPPLLSWTSFTGRRLITTNLLFKIVSTSASCPAPVLSMPAAGLEADRKIQSCFGTIAALQALLSIAGWLWLAIVFSRHLGGSASKLLSIGVVLLFGFTPQIAEWDNILGSESLSLSLFILSFAFLIEVIFEYAQTGGLSTTYGRLMAVSGFIVFTLWLFVKDSNLYAVPIIVLLLILLLLLKRGRNRWPVLICSIVLIGLFVLGLATSRQSPRWPPSIQHSMETFIYPFPGRIQFLHQYFGMPDPSSTSFQTWFSARAPTAFMGFLVTHPGFVLESIFDNWTIFTFSYVQPYFTMARTNSSWLPLQLGEMLHLDSGAFYLVDTIALAYFIAAALRRRTNATKVSWAGIFGWLYLTAAITLFVSFFGDTNGIMRHIFPSLETFRLMMWLSLVVLADVYLRDIDPNSMEKDKLAAVKG